MAEAFSLAAGTVNLVQLLYNVGVAIKQFHDAAGTVDQDIADLFRYTEMLKSTYSAIQDLWEKNRTRLPDSSLANPDGIEDLWQCVFAILTDCEAFVVQLNAIIDKINSYKEPMEPPGRWDTIKKTYKKEREMPGIKEKCMRMTHYHNSLQMLLVALTLSYNQSSQHSTGALLGHISETVAEIKVSLYSEIASLRAALAAANGNHSTKFLDAINLASAAARLVSINRHIHLPQPVSSIFTGREALLDHLQAAFDVFRISKRTSNVQKRFVVYGTGGSGKTQFCCKFAQDNQDNFWGVFYIDASTPQTAERSFAEIVKIAGIAPLEGSNQRSAKEWLSGHHESWLLLIDNADDPDWTQVGNYFPEGKRGCILVTTRNPANKIHGTVGSKSYEFQPLPTDEANDLLLRAAGKPAPWDPGTRKLAEPISQRLGCLPVALIQAGTAILRGMCQLKDYVKYLEKSWQRLRKAHSSRRNIEGSDFVTEKLFIYSSYEMNLEELEKSTSQPQIDAVQLLKMFSCFHFQNIRIDFLIAAVMNRREEESFQHESKEDEEVRLRAVSNTPTAAEYLRNKTTNITEFMLKDRTPPVLPAVLRDAEKLSLTEDMLETRLREALGHLTSMSLITRHEIGASESYSMHPLWHTWIRERPGMKLAEEALWCQAAKTTLAQCILLPPHGSSEPEEALRRSLLPHINHIQECQKDIDSRFEENRQSRPWSVAHFLSKTTTEILIRETTMTTREALQLAKFSRVYIDCIEWNKAEELQLRVKDFACAKLGADHPRVMEIYKFLALTYSLQTRSNEAAPLMTHVLQVYLKSLGPKHPKTLKVKDILGQIRCWQGRYRDSLRLHEEAVEAMEISFLQAGSEGLEVIEEAVKEIECNYQSKFEEVLEHHGESIRKMEGVSVNKAEDLFIAWNNLGVILWRYCRFEEARKFHKKSVLGLLALLGPNNSQTVGAMQDFATSHLDLMGEPAHSGPEQLVGAHAIIMRVADQRKKTLGEESPLTLLALGHLGRIESARGIHEEAERLYREIMPTARRVIGEHHFGIQAGGAHLAQILVRQGKYDEAESLLKQVVQKQKYSNQARDDGNHPDQIIHLWYLVRCYKYAGKTGEAIARAREVEGALEMIGGEGLGKEHPFAREVAKCITELEETQRRTQPEKTQKLYV